MAQVIVSYVGVATGGATFYYHKSPDNTSSATRIYNGNGVQLPADYYSRVTNNMFPIIGPGKGWMYSYNITDITPVYTTVTDKCTPPSSVTLNISTKVLTVNGGAGGDLNALVGWGISWRDLKNGEGKWSAWSSDVVITGRTRTVTVPAGFSREFRARTRGSAGANYFSAYKLCPTQLLGSVPSQKPTLMRPAQNAVSHRYSPKITIICPPDTEGVTRMLRRKIDDGDWTNVGLTPAAGEVRVNTLPTLAIGAHVIRYLITREGLDSEQATLLLTVSPVSWGRSIAPGGIISNQNISHQNDIREMYEVVNMQRAYYGLSPIKIPGVVGRFLHWRKQMVALQEGIGESLSVCGAPIPEWIYVPSWPTAAVVNQIRAAAVSE